MCIETAPTSKKQCQLCVYCSDHYGGHTVHTHVAGKILHVQQSNGFHGFAAITKALKCVESVQNLTVAVNRDRSQQNPAGPWIVHLLLSILHQRTNSTVHFFWVGCVLKLPSMVPPNNGNVSRLTKSLH